MAALIEVRVPDLGDYADVPIIEVLVAEGDTVAKESPLIVLESEKATMEVPSTAAGTVSSVSVGVGDTVSAGDVIVSVTSEEGPEDQDEPTAETPTDETTDEKPTEAESDAPAERPATDAQEPQPQADNPPDATPTSPPPAGPASRRLARQLGVDLETVTGSGRGGRITLEDVARAHTGGSQTSTAGAPTVAGLPDWPSLDFDAVGPTERTPLSRIQRISGPYLHRNWVGIPHVTQFDEADITDLEAFRKRTNAEQGEVKVTVLALVIRAVTAALARYPQFNASLDGDSLISKRYVSIGFAADTDEGLVVPVIRDADTKGVLEIARELSELAELARSGTLSREQMEGGSFTISSLGGIGGTAFTPIINAPDVAILGVSRAAMQPVWDGDSFQPRLVLPFSLSYDHRAIDGADAARFTTYLARLLSDPARMLL